MEENNKMKNEPVNKLMLQMGVPMILSMALQAVYNIVDSAFVGNMKEGSEANVIKLRNGIFEGNTKNVLLFFFVENLNFFVDIQIEMCGLLSEMIIGQLFIGICFWRYL